jgi:CRP/FNR family transcriptional regulator
MRPDVCADCPVRDQAICASLSAAELADLSAMGRHRNFARGETIFAADDDSVACATLVTGAAKLSRLDSEGTERIVGLVHPAGFLGQLFAATHHHEATALTDSRVCLFPRREFERFMTTHPALTRSILERTIAELDASRGLAELIGRRDVKARVAGLLLAFARAASPSPCGQAASSSCPEPRGDGEPARHHHRDGQPAADGAGAGGGDRAAWGAGAGDPGFGRLGSGGGLNGNPSPTLSREEGAHREAVGGEGLYFGRQQAPSPPKPRGLGHPVSREKRERQISRLPPKRRMPAGRRSRGHSPPLREAVRGWP